MTPPQSITYQSYFKGKFRIDKDGYAEALVKPGLELDRDI